MYLFYARPGCPVCVFPVYLLLQWCMGRAQTLISALEKILGGLAGSGDGVWGPGGVGGNLRFSYQVFNFLLVRPEGKGLGSWGF